MPKTPHEATTKEVQYPDDLPGEKWTIAEYAYYDSDDPEDAEELPEDAQYGYWLRAEKAGTDDETWLSCPRTVRERLLEEEAEEGDTFEVLELKRGDAEHDPYHAELRVLSNGDAL